MTIMKRGLLTADAIRHGLNAYELVCRETKGDDNETHQLIFSWMEIRSIELWDLWTCPFLKISISSGWNMLSPTLNAERRKEKFSKMPLEYSQMSSGRQKKLTSKKRKWIFNQNSCQEKLKWHFCSHMSSCSCYATVLTDWICLPDSTSQTFQVSLAMHTNGKSLTEDQWNRWKNWIRFSTFTCWDLMRFHQEHHTILFLLVWMLSQKISEKLFRVLNLKRLAHEHKHSMKATETSKGQAYVRSTTTS